MNDLELPTSEINEKNFSVEDEIDNTNSSISSCTSTDNIYEAENIAHEASSNKNIAESAEAKTSEECLALAVRKEHRLLVAQTMFKKSIKVSIKSFLISLSLTFLNFFI